MIHFFRRIRQGLINKEQAGKYLLYAIGEILLVVIGILIALQVNNWNENRNATRQKNVLLKSLKTEFTQNLDQLDSVLYYDKLVVKSALEVLELYHLDAAELHDDEMKTLLHNTGWGWTFDPQNGGLSSGISSGVINYIENQDLKDALFSWSDLVADANENEQRALDTRLKST